MLEGGAVEGGVGGGIAGGRVVSTTSCEAPSLDLDAPPVTPSSMGWNPSFAGLLSPCWFPKTLGGLLSVDYKYTMYCHWHVILCSAPNLCPILRKIG